MTTALKVPEGLISWDLFNINSDSTLLALCHNQPPRTHFTERTPYCRLCAE